MACPEPSGPVRNRRSPTHSRTGCTRAIASSSSPPTMIESVPASARTMPPDTGASTTATWRGASSAASDLVPTGFAELMSRSTEPGASVEAIPPFHSTIASRTA